tara:strand:+ start:203 stop:598 length:396 start_codon:yes stop_codon:yes gene_type:complete
LTTWTIDLIVSVEIFSNPFSNMHHKTFTIQSPVQPHHSYLADEQPRPQWFWCTTPAHGVDGTPRVLFLFAQFSRSRFQTHHPQTAFKNILAVDADHSFLFFFFLLSATPSPTTTPNHPTEEFQHGFHSILK